jgi:hypothetical protein
MKATSSKMKIVIPLNNQEVAFCGCLEVNNPSPVKTPHSALSPRRKKAREREKFTKKVVKVVASPIPYCVLVILLLMVVLIFVNVMPIAGLICVIAITMVLFIVMGNRWKDDLVWEEDSHHSQRSATANNNHHHHSNNANHSSHHPRSRSHTRTNSLPMIMETGSSTTSSMTIPFQPVQTTASPFVDSQTPEGGNDDLGPYTHEDKIDNLNEFFEDLFHSIDYSLLLIFLGTFIVVENLASTGLPKLIWKSIVGKVPFKSFSSIVGISLFVLIASQLLGNVAVVQLAKPNVHELNENDKRFAWALISFISTIGGNLTIAGSAGKLEILFFLYVLFIS